MGWTDFLLRLRALAHRRRAESDPDEELSLHLEMQARKKRAATPASSAASSRFASSAAMCAAWRARALEPCGPPSDPGFRLALERAAPL